MPSPTTINRRARKYGSKLKQFLPDCVAETDADAVIPDSTKCHSQDEGRLYHSVQATLGEDTEDESRSLLDLSVNADWGDTASELDHIDTVTDDAAVVSDGDSGIVTAFTGENREHQVDFVHVGRTLDYNLWDDDVFSLDRRNEIVSEVIDEVFYLKNSVAKHRPNDWHHVRIVVDSKQRETLAIVEFSVKIDGLDLSAKAVEEAKKFSENTAGSAAADETAHH